MHGLIDKMPEENLKKSELQEKTTDIDGFYISSLNNVVTVTQGRVRLSDSANETYHLSHYKDMIKLGSWTLKNQTTTQVVWKNEDSDSTITWNKVTAELAIQYLATQNTQARHSIGQKSDTCDKMNEKWNKMKLLNEIRFPLLIDADFMANHLTSIVRISINLKLMDEVGEVDDLIEGPFVLKVISTLGEETCRRTAEEIVRLHGEDWTRLHTALRRRFCRRDILKNSLYRRLRNLELTDIKDYEQFINSSSSILNLGNHIYGPNEAETRTLMREIISKLPDEIKREIIFKLHNIAKGMDWETAIPFDEFSMNSEQTCVADIIREICSADLEAKSLSRKKYLPNKPQENKFPQNRAPPPEDRKDIFKWAESKKTVLIIRGAAVSDQHRVDELLEKLNKPDHRKIIGRTGKPYFLVGFETDEDQTNRVQSLIPAAIVEKFNTSQKKNVM